jgi:hypothetical protein
MIQDRPTALRFNPFPGLRPFEPDEDYLFFGRERQVDELVHRLRTTRFLAILGTSGSGKSSLVRSGLIPSLHGGAMTQAGSSWRVAILRPGENPLGNLADALREALGWEGDTDGLFRAFFETTLRASKLGLVECVRQARLRERDNVLVLVDQFEELFRFKQSRKDAGHAEALAFVKLLVEASRQNESHLYVALTMRSDFIGNCMEFAELPEVINEGLYLVPRMTRDELRAAVTGPVAVGGTSISPRLVSRLLNDIGDSPDQLPILQHALMRTWNRWERDHARGQEPLDLRHYEAVGTMGQALSQHAEEALGELDEKGQRIAETLFKALTDKGTDGRGIRRPATVGEICATTGAAEAAVAAVVERFRLPGRSFVMPPVGTALRTGTVLDISHESLMRIWERLAAWVDEEAQSAQIYLGVARAAARHEEGGAALWRGPELQVALTWRQTLQPTEAWARRYDPGFASAMRFLDASEDERRREAGAREEQRRGEQRRRLWLWLACVLSAAALVSAAFGAYALVQKRRSDAAAIQEQMQRRKADNAMHTAKEQQLDALRQKLLAEAKQQELLRQKAITEAERARAENQGRLAVMQRRIAEEERKRAEAQQLVAEAKIVEADAAHQEADSGRRQASQEKTRADHSLSQAEDAERETARLRRLALAHTAALQALHLPAGQDELAALLALRAYRLHLDNGGAEEDPAPFNALRAALEHLRLDQSLPPQPAWNDAREPVRAVAVDPRGTALFAAAEDGHLRHINLLHPGAPGTDLAAFSQGVRALAVDAKGTLLAAGAADGSLRVLDLRAGTARRLTRSGSPVAALALQPAGALLAAGRADGSLGLWDLGNPDAPPRELLSGGGKVAAVAFSPDGATLAAGLGKAGARLWNVREPSATLQAACIGLDVRSLAFSPQGKTLACGTATGEIVLDGFQPGAPTLSGHLSSVSALSFSPQGNSLVSGGADHTVRLWDLKRSDAEPIVLTGHPSMVWSVAFLPDGEQVVSGGADRTVRLWEARSSRLAAELCRRISRPLTEEEWKRLFPPSLPFDGGQVCPPGAAPRL